MQAQAGSGLWIVKNGPPTPSCSQEVPLSMKVQEAKAAVLFHGKLSLLVGILSVEFYTQDGDVEAPEIQAGHDRRRKSRRGGVCKRFICC